MLVCRLIIQSVKPHKRYLFTGSALRVTDMCHSMAVVVKKSKSHPTIASYKNTLLCDCCFAIIPKYFSILVRIKLKNTNLRKHTFLYFYKRI